MDVTILAALKIFDIPWLIRQRVAVYAFAISGMTNPSLSFSGTAFKISANAGCSGIVFGHFVTTRKAVLCLRRSSF